MTAGTRREAPPLEVQIVAVPETAGSALYGMVDVLMSAGSVWQTLVRSDTQQRLFRVRIVSPGRQPFACGYGIPVTPDFAIDEAPVARLLILPELWLGPDEDIKGRYPELMAWIRRQFQLGASLYSACSGAVMLAETGLLDGCPATSHWGYQELFRQRYPKVRFLPQPNLVFADPAGRIVTAGGSTSWHDLALHLIARYAGTGEALRIAKAYLLKWHHEGQLPYASLVPSAPHADSVVRKCQQWLEAHYHDHSALLGVIDYAGLPERTLKRRFKAATGLTLIEYVQNLRIDEAKRLLETTTMAVEEISAAVSYEDHSFFRRLFKRLTGLKPSHYRRLFQPLLSASEASPGSG